MIELQKMGKECPGAPPGHDRRIDIEAFINMERGYGFTRFVNTNWSTWNATIREYENGRVVIRVFSERNGVPGRIDNESPGTSTEEEKLRVAVTRARNAIFDIALGNHWDYFITLTFDRKVVGDRYSYDNVKKHMDSFTKYLRRHGCQWLLIPEYHKDKAYHFHGLISGHLESRYRETKFAGDGVPYDCYSIEGYHKGRSDISPIKDPGRVSSYITKYITKEGLSCVPKNGKKYWASQGLLKPTKKRAYLAPNEVSSLSASAHYISTRTDRYGNDIITLVL